jgi:hypothetical protein
MYSFLGGICLYLIIFKNDDNFLILLIVFLFFLKDFFWVLILPSEIPKFFYLITLILGYFLMFVFDTKK